MDARDRLRLYLEQRRDLGESDLTLDELPVADVLSILGAADSGSSGGGNSGAGKADPSAAATPVSSAKPAPPRARVAEPRPSSLEAAPASAPAPEPSAAQPPPPPTSRIDPNAATGDWRQVLGTTDSAATPEKERPAAATPAVTDQAPQWLSALGLPLGHAVGDAASTGAARPAAPADEVNAADAADTLESIAAAAAACTGCALHSSATQSVPGEGNPLADFVCVGEAPGQSEDESGRPFVGAAGQLLTKILGAIDLGRDDVFICNVLKHRPPGNRNPLPAEVAACRPFLERQLALLKPRVILALGTFAAQTLLDTRESLGTLRGRIHRYHGIPLVVTYHPAALLRNAAWKRPTWDDVQLARRIHDASREAEKA